MFYLNGMNGINEIPLFEFNKNTFKGQFLREKKSTFPLKVKIVISTQYMIL